jgi:hypothetical protein
MCPVLAEKFTKETGETPSNNDVRLREFYDKALTCPYMKKSFETCPFLKSQTSSCPYFLKKHDEKETEEKHEEKETEHDKLAPISLQVTESGLLVPNFTEKE